MCAGGNPKIYNALYSSRIILMATWFSLGVAGSIAFLFHLCHANMYVQFWAIHKWEMIHHLHHRRGVMILMSMYPIHLPIIFFLLSCTHPFSLLMLLSSGTIQFFSLDNRKKKVMCVRYYYQQSSTNQCTLRRLLRKHFFLFPIFAKEKKLFQISKHLFFVRHCVIIFLKGSRRKWKKVKMYTSH